MTCEQFQAGYSDWRDNRAPSQSSGMVEHLATCIPCRRRHRALVLGVAVLRTSAPQPARDLTRAFPPPPDPAA